MIVFDKDFKKTFSVKIIILVVILTIALYFLPALIPLVIAILILWIIYEGKERERGIKIQNYNIKQLKILLHRAFREGSGLVYVIGGPVKEISGEELMEEYKEKHEWNKYELEKLKEKEYKEKMHDIDTIKNDLGIVKSFYNSILHHSKDIIPEYRLEEGVNLVESKLKEIEKFENKKIYSIKDLIEIKDIFDTCHYFGERMVLDSTRYNDTRSFSDKLLIDIKMLAKENKIKLSSYPTFYFFWTPSFDM